MTNPITVQEWLDVVNREYLSTFIKDGGAAVKFAVADERNRSMARESLKSRCAEMDYAFASLDAVTCRAHMPQDLFFALASQLDWQFLARRLILRLLAEGDYRVEEIDPGNTANVVSAVARANNLEAGYIIQGLHQKLQNEVFKNPNMVRAFRVAMTCLCRMEWETLPDGGYAGQPLLDWLTGSNTRIGAVHPFQVYTPINRTTARYFIESALYWVRRAGYSGTAIVLDNARVTLTRNPRDGQRHYTRAMTMDHYEVLREFIDDVDRLSATLLVVVTDEAFAENDSPRGWSLYPALRTRVMDDVRDKNIVNPVAALVRLS